MKELETLGNKVGVISNTVKDVLQSLIDDNMVETDKIGIGNFLWALPSKGRQLRLNKLEALKSELMSLKTQKKSLSQQIENQLKEKPESSERLEKIQELKKYSISLQDLKKQRDSLKSCTKSYYDECVQKVTSSTDLCNKYTEDIFTAISYLKSQNPSLSSSDINKHFGVPEDLDML